MAAVFTSGFCLLLLFPCKVFRKDFLTKWATGGPLAWSKYTSDIFISLRYSKTLTLSGVFRVFLCYRVKLNFEVSLHLLALCCAHLDIYRLCFIVSSYVQYSNIAARVLRKCLKPELRADAIKREESNVKVTAWKDGKPNRKYRIDAIFH